MGIWNRTPYPEEAIDVTSDLKEGRHVRKALWAIVLIALLGVGSVVGAASAQGVQGEGLIDMEFEGARLADVLRVLGELGGYNVIVDSGVEGNVTFRLHGMTIDEAIEMVVRTSGYSYRRMGNTLVVGAEATLKSRFDTVQSKLFPLEHADPAALLSVLRLLVPGIEAQADTSQRALVVRGTSKELAEVERLVRERDVRPPVDQEFVETPVVEILRTLARLGGYNLVVQGDVAGTMTVVLSNQPVEAAIDLVARRAGLAYEIDGVDLFVIGQSSQVAEDQEAETTRSVLPLQSRERRIIRLAHISPAKIIDAVQLLAGGGEVWADEETRTIIVSAGASALRQVDELIALFDVPNVLLRGVLRQGDEHLAIVQIDQESYIVRTGDRVGTVAVVAIDADGVTIETIHGQRLQVPAGGK